MTRTSPRVIGMLGAGAELLFIGTNTMHQVADQIQDAVSLDRDTNRERV